MLTIRQDLVDAMVAHARADHPDEACGVIAGPAGSDRPERFIPMVNAARSPTFYEFDSTDLLRLYRDMDDRDEVPVVIYHSHTATEAYPSRTDVSYASEPDAHYVLVSTRETGTEDGFALAEPLEGLAIVDGHDLHKSPGHGLPIVEDPRGLAAAGPPVVAMQGGTVVKAGWNAGGYGNFVVIDHGNGYRTLYGHLQKYAVVVGQTVKRGDVIGYVGSTGKSTGPHLHFEVRGAKNFLGDNPRYGL